MTTRIEVDCFEVDIEKLGSALNVTRAMPHKRLEAAQDVLRELVKALTLESRKKWEQYQKENDPCYSEELEETIYECQQDRINAILEA